MQVKQCGICLLLREKERVSGHGVAKTQRAQALTAAEAGDWARRAQYTLYNKYTYLLGSLPDKKESNEKKYWAKT